MKHGWLIVIVVIAFAPMGTSEITARTLLLHLLPASKEVSVDVRTIHHGGIEFTVRRSDAKSRFSSRKALLSIWSESEKIAVCNVDGSSQNGTISYKFTTLPSYVRYSTFTLCEYPTEVGRHNDREIVGPAECYEVRLVDFVAKLSLPRPKNRREGE